MALIAHHALRIEQLSVMVNLGCTLDEQSERQEVRVTAEFRFHEAPLGLASDRLEHTICYAEISQMIREVAEAQPFHLIEKLAGDIFVRIAEHTRGSAMIGLKIHKVRPPVENLHGGSHYLCGDFLL